MAKAGKKYKAWREKHGYPIGPSAVKSASGPKISSPGKHTFKSPKGIKKGK